MPPSAQLLSLQPFGLGSGGDWLLVVGGLLVSVAAQGFNSACRPLKGRGERFLRHPTGPPLSKSFPILPLVYQAPTVNRYNQFVSLILDFHRAERHYACPAL